MPNDYKHPRPMAQDQTRAPVGPRDPGWLQRYLAWRAGEAARARRWEQEHGLARNPQGFGTTVRNLLAQVPGAERVPDQAADVGEGLLNFLMGSGHPGEFVEGPAMAGIPLLARLRRMVARREAGEGASRNVLDILESAARREGVGVKPGTAEQIAADERRTLDIATRLAKELDR